MYMHLCIYMSMYMFRMCAIPQHYETVGFQTDTPSLEFVCLNMIRKIDFKWLQVEK